MKRIAAIGILLLVGLASPARSGVIWAEVGDAGDLTSTAQNTSGAGALDTISGQLGDPNDFTGFLDIDVYRLYISDPAQFSAWTVDSVFNVSDPQLFLFDEAGRGVYMNDDDETGLNGAQSLLPAGHAFGPTTAGFYYLAIGWFDNEPLDALASLIFGGGLGTNGPASLDALASWNLDVLGRPDLPNAYQINLVGAAVPEPSTLALLAAGLCMALRRRARRSR